MTKPPINLPRSLILGGLFGALALANLPYVFMRLEQRVFAQNNTNAVTVTWVTPTNGAIVSNTIPLVVNAGSSVAPIVRVEFYRDGQLIGVVTPQAQQPNLNNVISP